MCDRHTASTLGRNIQRRIRGYLRRAAPEMVLPLRKTRPLDEALRDKGPSGTVALEDSQLVRTDQNPYMVVECGQMSKHFVTAHEKS